MTIVPKSLHTHIPAVQKGNDSFSKDADFRIGITIEQGKRSGQPCIRGMRITVYDVFEYLASGMTVAEVLNDF